ncbi:MAG: thiaminase II [Rhodospirillaceae bacterium]|nr:thiaminase II [Rhodospirillaceae bacterium]MCA8932825.1 thiaminase II [Rhodospirillaceae bacterium]
MSEFYARLRAADPETWQAYVEHPFVQALGDGSLPRACFVHYLRQDYVFLIHFIRAYALGVHKTDRIEEIRQLAGTVHALSEFEMQLHIQTCAREGLSEADLAATPEERENLSYTRYVLDLGQRGDLLDLLVAQAPCVLGYGEIGRRLAAETGGPPAGHPYAEWIATYASEEFREVGARHEALMEAVCRRRLGAKPWTSPRWAELAASFATASRLEAGFWDMGLRGG